MLRRVLGGGERTAKEPTKTEETVTPAEEEEFDWGNAGKK